MIVTINEKNKYLYQALFEKASADIGKSISTLNEYYHYLPELAEKSFRYLMIPLDETPVEIDANQRAMKVPMTLSKCASVQNDHMAEAITFVVDRYYDFMDLSTTEIYVQWRHADNAESQYDAQKINEQESQLDLSTPDKIRFTWPLTKDITKNPGNIEFSVRFFRRNENDVCYSFNTLSSVIAIKPALYPEINSEAQVEKPLASGYFAKAIISNQLSGEGQPVPLNPSFAAPGLDLPETAALKDDTLTLNAQAVVGDTGIITYTWYYKPEGAEEFGEIASSIAMVKMNPQPTSRDILDEYYIANASQATGYELYTGAIPHPEGKELYEKFTSYTVPSSGDVTGVYKVEAVNTLGSNTTINPVWSTDCLLPGPAAIELTTDLQPEISMDKKGTAVTLSVAAAPDEHKPAVSYKWYNGSVNESSLTEISGATGTSYSVTQPGWYQAEISASMNRKTQTKRSEVCKITAYPYTPVATLEAFDGESQIGEGAYELNAGKTLVLKATASISAEDADKYKDIGNTALYEGEFTYVWEVMEQDKKWELLTETHPTYEEMNNVGKTSSLTIKSPVGSPAYSYRCTINHKLSGAEAAVTTESPFIIY